MIYQDIYDAHLDSDMGQKFLERLVKNGWCSRTQEVVVDVGCSAGKVTVEKILPCFQNPRRIIGIDNQPSAIELAKSKYSIPGLEFHIGDIEDSLTAEKWRETATRVVSHYCIHFVRDQRKAFQNVFQILQRGGEAAFEFLLQHPVFDATLEVIRSEKWSSLLQGAERTLPESFRHQHSSDYYVDLLRSLGFQVLFCETTAEKLLPYPEEKYKNLFFSVCAVSSWIPENLIEDFKSDFYTAVLNQKSFYKDDSKEFTKIVLTLTVKKRA